MARTLTRPLLLLALPTLRDGSPRRGRPLRPAVRITRATYPQGANVVYLARADHFPDALVAGNLSDGPVLLVPSCDDVPTVVLDEIRRLDPQRVVALGGDLAVCADVLRAAADA